MLEPVGFWSYTRHDNKHSGGHVSQLRALVGSAIAMRHGSDLPLWQDVEDIAYGSNWAADIKKAIGLTTFYIPIVTPRFLKSQYCLDEFKTFRSRMIALGRDNLIYPVHYIDVDGVLPTETIFCEGLADLRRHQWNDFRPHRFNHKEHEVRAWADRFAADILLALRQPEANAPIVQPPVITQNAAPAFIGEGNSNITVHTQEIRIEPLVSIEPSKLNSAKGGEHPIGLIGEKSQSADEQFKIAWEYYTARDFGPALYWFREAADQGDVEAKYYIGRIYAQGYGVPKDYLQAITWYHKAADHGLEYGRGTRKNYTEAMSWYRKAADQDLAEAQFNIGRLYEKGRGVEIDIAQANVWYQMAAGQDYETANKALKRLSRPWGNWL